MFRRIRWWLLRRLAGSACVVIGAKIDGALIPEGTVVGASANWQGPAILRTRNENTELMWG
jgi:hypothetical protein